MRTDHGASGDAVPEPRGYWARGVDLAWAALMGDGLNIVFGSPALENGKIGTKSALTDDDVYRPEFASCIVYEL